MPGVTTYNEKMQAKIDEYLDVYETPIPSVAGLSLYLGVTRACIYKWSKVPENTALVESLARLSATQEEKALTGGLLGDYNSTITKLVLANHGYSDKAEVKTEITTNDMTDEQLTARLKSLINAVDD